MRILVTGGAGYIGSHLVDQLMGDGNHVYVVDNLFTGKIDNIRHHLGHDRFTFVNDTILNPETVEYLVRQVDMVYHLAAVVGVKHVLDNPMLGIITNLRGTEIVLELAFKYWVKTVVVSSSEVYGKSERVPLAEDDDAILGPTAVGRWSYALAKALDEHLAFVYHSRGLPTTILRYFNSYGPRLDPRGYGSVMAKFVNQALDGRPITVYGDGTQTRCFTYVDDTVRGTILAGTTPEGEGKAFNIGNNRETTILELAHLVRDAAGANVDVVHVPYTAAYGSNFEETHRRVPDVTRAGQILGFKAQVPLEDGLARTMNWFRKTREKRGE